jgi:hypothetical protein
LAWLALVALAPMAWLANRVAARRDATATPNWTSVVVELEVVRRDVSPLHYAKRAPAGRMNAARDRT